MISLTSGYLPFSNNLRPRSKTFLSAFSHPKPILRSEIGTWENLFNTELWRKIPPKSISTVIYIFSFSVHIWLGWYSSLHQPSQQFPVPLNQQWYQNHAEEVRWYCGKTSPKNHSEIIKIRSSIHHYQCR